MMRTLLLLTAVALTACATTPATDMPEEQAAADPLEGFNRSMFVVNRFGDKILYKPFGQAYKAVVPSFARKGVYNFFDNLTTPRSALNNVLQGKPGRGLSEMGRFVFNSVLGVGGLFNIAAAGGLPRYDEDFSQTLAVWGIPDGPYLVVPIWGPRTVLSAASIPLDFYTDLQRQISPTGTRDKLYALRLIDTRSRLLTTEEILNKSQDPYIAFREAYLQNRRFEIYDGNPPLQDDYYYFDEDESD